MAISIGNARRLQRINWISISDCGAMVGRISDSCIQVVAIELLRPLTVNNCYWTSGYFLWL